MHNMDFKVIPGVINEEKWDELICIYGEESGKSIKELLTSQDKRKKTLRK